MVGRVESWIEASPDGVRPSSSRPPVLGTVLIFHFAGTLTDSGKGLSVRRVRGVVRISWVLGALAVEVSVLAGGGLGFSSHATTKAIITVRSQRFLRIIGAFCSRMSLFATV